MSVTEPDKSQPLRPNSGLKIDMLSTGGSGGKRKVMVTNFLVILCWIFGGFLVEAIRQNTAHLEGL
jgi:hypothetical protein